LSPWPLVIRMQRARILFGLSALVALMWSSWLFYMVKVAADPVVVSAPQLHHAALVVVGSVTVEGEQASVAIDKVLKDSLKPLRPTPLPTQVTVLGWKSDYAHQGKVLLALVKSMQGEKYEVAPVPLPTQYLPPRVYVYTDSVRIQAERVLGK
jgi:hypothetical protein